MVQDNWAHKSKTMRCHTCMWYVPKGEPEADAGVYNRPLHLGRCRKRAPALDGWPAVFTDDWCGDHKLDSEKL